MLIEWRELLGVSLDWLRNKTESRLVVFPLSVKGRLFFFLSLGNSGCQSVSKTGRKEKLGQDGSFSTISSDQLNSCRLFSSSSITNTTPLQTISHEKIFFCPIFYRNELKLVADLVKTGDHTWLVLFHYNWAPLEDIERSLINY